MEEMMGKNMEAPERIWADRTGIECAVEIGCWADTVRYMGGVEYIRADLAAPSAPAEVGGLTDTQKIERMADLNWKPASQYWKEQHDAKATALTALQAENERLRGERDAWKANADALAVALKVTRDDLLSALHSEFDGVWSEADFDEESASADDALASHAKLKGDV